MHDIIITTCLDVFKELLKKIEETPGPQTLSEAEHMRRVVIPGFIESFEVRELGAWIRQEWH